MLFLIALGLFATAVIAYFFLNPDDPKKKRLKIANGIASLGLLFLLAGVVEPFTQVAAYSKISFIVLFFAKIVDIYIDEGFTLKGHIKVFLDVASLVLVLLGAQLVLYNLGDPLCGSGGLY
ncbi:hypothetical protein SY88_05595 [Clostridiales bacterium PH28_bin88]|nr:hypothetical protein SY88_05595 [Clostridiales bacterium PH28_bin88]